MICCPRFVVYQNVNLSGFDMKGMPLENIPSESQCQSDYITYNCDAYNYSTSDKKCWLKLGNQSAGENTGIRMNTQ